MSGGIDSTAVARFHVEAASPSVVGLFVDYGQPPAQREFEAADAVTKYLGVPLRFLQVRGATRKTAGLIFGRNAFLLSVALLESNPDTSIISIGVHAGTSYRDCSPGFIRLMQHLADLYSGGTVQISAPFLHWTKTQIWAYFVERGLPLQLTSSCELGESTPCGNCLSCVDRSRLLLNAGP